MRIRGGWISSEISHFILTGIAMLALLVSFSGAAFGQAASGTITGTVTDPKGLVVPGVSLVVRNTDTGIEKTMETNNVGIYNAPLLQPGNYEVVASKEGFATVDHKGITVLVGQTLAIDMQMPLQSQQSVVTVTTEAPLIETEKTEMSETLNENLVGGLPTSTRRWESFVLLTPGVTTDGTGGNLSFHGINSMYNNNTVDGANNNNAYNSTARGDANANSSGIDGYTYSTDSIKEFQVSSNNYNAEFGQAAGGQVNAVTKSGTNMLHGDLFYNFRYPTFNALDPVVKANAVQNGAIPTQSIHQQNQFGGSVGGPIKTDKLFYFFTYDGYRKVTPVSFTTSAGLGGTAPISALGCPTVITQNQCSAAKNWALNDNLGTFPRELRQDVLFGKIDYQVNQANHVNAAFDWRNWYVPNGTAYASVANSGLGAQANLFIQDRFAIVSWDSVMSSNKVNELRYQWGEDNTWEDWLAPAPSVALTNLFTYGLNNANPAIINEIRNQVSDNFSFSHGRHAFKAGVDVNFIHEIAKISINSSGLYSYSSGVSLPGTDCPAAPVTSTSSATEQLILCDWLVDLYQVKIPNDTRPVGEHWSSFTQIKDQRFPGNQLGSPAGTDSFYENDYAGFFEDTWKIRTNLTLNLGIRYDIQHFPPLPNPNTATAILAEYTSILNIDYGGLQPRIGVAWNVANNTVLRVGFGTFYAKTTNSTVSAARRTSGTREQSFTCSATNLTPVGFTSGICSTLGVFPNVFFGQYATPGTAFSSPLLSAAQEPPAPVVTNPAFNACPSTTCSVRGIDSGAVRPRALEGDVTFEKQLAGLSISASYMVTRGEHLPSHADANLALPTATKTYDVVGLATGTGGSTLLTTTVPFFTQRLDASQGASVLTGAILAESSIVNSWYNSMVLTLRKPIGSGLDLLANYTFAKATDDGQQGGGSGNGGGIFFGTNGVLNPYNQKGEEGASSLDVRNHVAGSVVWTPPYAKNVSNRTERGFLDGWSLSTTVTVSGGQPYSGLVSSTAVQCLVPVSPCPAGDSGLDGGMTGAILGSSGNPAGGRIAWMPPNSFRLPTWSDVDFRLTKEFSIRERYNFEFRFEAFNSLNSTILQGVNNTGWNFALPGAPGCVGHTNACMVPVAGFQTPTVTSSNLLGARQLQLGAKFNF